MLKKSALFMMFLAASLIGASSIMYNQPQVVIGQPLGSSSSPPQQQQQQQLQSPNTAQNTLGKRPASPQGLQQQQAT